MLPKADVLPEGKVKGIVGSAGKADVAAGGARKQKVSDTVKISSTGSVTKNQQKIQSQTVSTTLSTTSKKTSTLENKTVLLAGNEWEEYFKEKCGTQNVMRQKQEMLGGGGRFYWK